MQERQLDPWVGKIPWRGKDQRTPVLSPGKPQDRGAWRLRSTGSPECDLTAHAARTHVSKSWRFKPRE